MTQPPFDKALPGHFYAVGVGPGAPDLVTLRAARLVQTADVIVAPRSSLAGDSLALAAVRDLLTTQEVIEKTYPMERDNGKTEAFWGEVAGLCADRCARGQSVVQITIGDPLIYSTSSYLLGQLAGQMEAGLIHIVPGISAFQAASSRFGDALTLQEDRLMLMPATDMAEVAAALERCETLVLYKVGPRLPALVELLGARGLLDRARLACRAEQGEGEIYLKDLTTPPAREVGYMSTVIIHLGRKGWA